LIVGNAGVFFELCWSSHLLVLSFRYDTVERMEL
jgi:hypothetical protein